MTSRRRGAFRMRSVVTVLGATISTGCGLILDIEDPYPAVDGASAPEASAEAGERRDAQLSGDTPPAEVPTSRLDGGPLNVTEGIGRRSRQRARGGCQD